jgi:hypothetical protein
MKIQQSVSILTITLIVLFSYKVQCANFNVTTVIDSFISPFNVHVGWIPAISTSTGIQAKCDTMLCSFYLFNSEQLQIYIQSNGTSGTPIVSEIAFFPNTVITLNIPSNAQQDNFKTRYGGPVWLVIRNLGINNTHVTGTRFAYIYVATWILAIVPLAIVSPCLCCVCCICCCICMCCRRKNRKYERLLEPAVVNNNSYNTIYPQVYSQQQQQAPIYNPNYNPNYHL